MQRMIAPGEPIAPYLNPAYWGGNMTGGYGLALPETTGEDRVSTRRKSLATSQLAIEAYLSATDEYVPIQTYGDGEVFDPKDHAVGSVFAMRTETLIGPAVPQEDLAYYAHQPLPLRPVDAVPDYENPLAGDKILRAADERTLAYISRALIGVVGYNMQKGHAMHMVEVANVAAAERNDAIIRIRGRLFSAGDAPITVGKVARRDWPGLGALQRSNVVNILSRGN